MFSSMARQRAARQQKIMAEIVSIANKQRRENGMPPLEHGPSPEAVARAFGAKLARDFPGRWAQLLCAAVQAGMQEERNTDAGRSPVDN